MQFKISVFRSLPDFHSLAKKYLTGLLSVLLLITPALASGIGDPAAAQRLNDLLKQMESLEGNFSQVITDEEGEVVEENTGKFRLKRPGLFYWEIDPPFEKIIVSNQKKIWTYDPDLEQVTIDNHNDDMMQSPMLLLSGDLDKIQENFDVQSINAGAANETAFELLPATKNDMFVSMTLRFIDKRLTKMTLNNTLGEKQAYDFKNLTLNGINDISIFEFQPPANVDIIVNDQ